jgi:hypothetical protein
MRDLPSSLQAPAANDRSQQSGALLRHRLYGMKYVSDFTLDRSGGAPEEILDSTNMETRPLRQR